MQGCICSSWYGWTGPNCDQFSSPQIVFQAVFSVSYTVLFLIIGIASLVDLQRLVWQRKALTEAKRTASLPVFLALLQLFIGALLTSAENALYSAQYFFPNLATSTTSFSDDEKASAFSLPLNVCEVIGFVALLAAVATMSWSWLDIAVRSEHLIGHASKTKLQYLVITYEVLLLLVNFGNLIFGSLTYRLIVLFPFLIVIAVCYFLAFIKLRRTFARLESMGDAHISPRGNTPVEKHNKYAAVLNQIFYTVIGIGSLFFLFFALAIGYTMEASIGWKETFPGNINPSPAFLIIAELCLVLVAFMISYSLRQSINRLVHRETEQASGGGQSVRQSTGATAGDNKHQVVAMSHTFSSDSKSQP